MEHKKPSLPPLYFYETFKKKYKDDFRRFLIKHKALDPLLYIEMVNGMMKSIDMNFQRHQANQIWKKFFKNTNGKTLQCPDKIINLLSSAINLTPHLLSRAVPAVTESLNRKWFKKYQASYYDYPKGIRYHLSPPRPIYRNKKTANECLRKIVYMMKEFNRYNVRNTLTNYITFLHHGQLRGLKEVSQEKQITDLISLNEYRYDKKTKRKLLPMTNLLSYLKLPEYSALINRINFFFDTLRYKKLYESIAKKRRMSTKQKSLKIKAQTIVKKYIKIEKDQSNPLMIPADLIMKPVMKFQREGVSLGLFHEISIYIFPSVYKVWDLMHIEQNASGGRENFISTLKLRLNVDIKEVLNDYSVVCVKLAQPNISKLEDKKKVTAAIKSFKNFNEWIHSHIGTFYIQDQYLNLIPSGDMLVLQHSLKRIRTTKL